MLSRLGIGIVVLLAAGCASTARTATAPLGTSAPATAAPSCLPGESVALSLASGVGGAASPVAASLDFAARDQSILRVPSSGWRVVRKDTSGVWVRSGDSELRAIQGPDRTWQIDSAHRCQAGS
jgi:hypothetical protein